MTLGSRLKSARSHANLTQSALAQRVGISQQTLADLERGRNRTSGRITEIALECGVSPEWLARGTGQMQPDGAVEASGQAATLPRRKSALDRSILNRAIQLLDTALEALNYSLPSDDYGKSLAEIYDILVENGPFAAESLVLIITRIIRRAHRQT